MDFGAFPPEVNSARMYAGPGAGSMLAAAEAWGGLSADLQAMASSAESVITRLTAEAWEGPASVSMNAAVAPYLAWIAATAPQLEQVAGQARAAAGAYEAAFAMTVPPPVIAANRAQLLALIATNFLGVNTAAIMATEAHYSEMWAQDATAMYGYAANSAAATTLTPFTSPKSATNPAGSTSQSAAAAHAAGTAAGHHAQTATSSMAQTLQGLSNPGTTPSGLDQVALGTGTSAATSAVSTPTGMLGSMTGATGKAAGKTAEAGGALGGMAAATSGADLGLIEDTIGFGEDGIGLVALDGGGVGLDVIGVGLDFLGADELAESGGLGALGALPLGGGLGDVGAASGVGAAASVGQAASLSGLSVPQNWVDVSGAASPASLVHSPAAMAVPNGAVGGAPAASTTGVAAPKLTFPSLMERESDGMQRIGLRSNMLPRPLVG